MEPTEDSETSAEFKRTPGIYPKEHIQYSKPDESLKSRFFKCVDKIQVSLKSYKNTGTFHEYQCTFMITSRPFLVRMRNVSHVADENTHFTFITFFSESDAGYETVWRNMAEPGRPQTTM